MITGFFPVSGFALIILGLLLMLRATGLVKRDSPFFRFHVRLGAVLVFAGGIILVLSIIL
jgi:hypothetical protein